MRRRSIVAALVASAALTLSATPSPFAVSQPAGIADLDLGKLKGTPTCLAWSETADEFYLQTVDDESKTRHYIIRVGSQPEGADTEPPWATTYWTWKSTRYVPGHHEMTIDVDSRNDLNQVPTQSLREKAAGMSNGTTAIRGADEAGMGSKTTVKLLLKGEVIGEFVDAPLVPGLTFGWSPESLQAVAYVRRNGRLVLMDVISGAKQEVASTSNALLPAWSPDGSRIVYLQKTGRKKFTLMQVSVSRD